MISSNATWQNDPSLVIRELLQNAVEACRYRKFNSSQSDKYEPKIVIKFDSKTKKITITDNGCGMSRNTILNNFLTVGNSRSFDPTYSSEKYNSLARFGIGFWSVFTIAEKAKVKTAPFEYLNNETSLNTDVKCLEFDVTINEFRDYTVFKPTISTPGTTIILEIKDNIRIEDIPLRLNYHIVCSDIPITIKTAFEEYKIPKHLKFPTFEEYFGVKANLAKSEDIKMFCFESIEKNLDFKAFIFYRMGQNATFLLTDTRKSVFQLNIDNPQNQIGRIAICGFQTNFMGRNFCFEISRVGGFLVNKKDPGGISFTLNRNAILSSPQSQELNEKINIQIHESYKKFLVQTNSYNTETIYNLNKQSRMHGGGSNSFDYEFKSLEFFLKRFPELICFKFFKIERGKLINNCEVIYANLDTIRKLNIKVVGSLTELYFPYMQMNASYEEKFPFIFSFLSNIESLHGFYLQEQCAEAGIVNSYTRDSCIKIFNLQNLSLAISIGSTSELNFENSNMHLVGFVHGQYWAGPIYEKEIDNSNFVFIGMQLIIVKKGSSIAQEFREMYGNGEYFKLSKIIKLLYQSTQGFIGESIKKYLH